MLTRYLNQKIVLIFAISQIFFLGAVVGQINYFPDSSEWVTNYLEGNTGVQYNSEYQFSTDPEENVNGYLDAVVEVENVDLSSIQDYETTYFTLQFKEQHETLFDNSRLRVYINVPGSSPVKIIDINESTQDVIEDISFANGNIVKVFLRVNGTAPTQVGGIGILKLGDGDRTLAGLGNGTTNGRLSKPKPCRPVSQDQDEMTLQTDIVLTNYGQTAEDVVVTANLLDDQGEILETKSLFVGDVAYGSIQIDFTFEEVYVLGCPVYFVQFTVEGSNLYTFQDSYLKIFNYGCACSCKEKYIEMLSNETTKALLQYFPVQYNYMMQIIDSICNEGDHNGMQAAPPVDSELMSRNGFEVPFDKPGFSESVKINPNPFQNRFELTYQLDNPTLTQIVIYDTVGKQIKTVLNQQEQIAGKYYLMEDLSDWPAGLYYLTIMRNNEVNSYKLLKQ